MGSEFEEDTGYSVQEFPKQVRKLMDLTLRKVQTFDVLKVWDLEGDVVQWLNDFA